MYDHEQTLARFNKMLEDKDFVGSEMEDSKGRKVSFRQKIEKEIPVLEGRIAECKALIKSMEDMGKIPSQARIDEIIDELSQSNAQ